MLPTDKTARKERPMARGLLDYFPDALAEVAHVSFVGNQQHNPGEELHWVRGKSMDHADCVIRHLAERGTVDDDGLRHAAKAAWRALALLQIELEEAKLPTFDGVPIHFVDELAPTLSMSGCGSESQISVARDDDSQNDRARTFYGDQHGTITTYLPPAQRDTRPRLLTNEETTALVQSLVASGCLSSVIPHIVGGLSLPNRGNRGDTIPVVYIAGPMRNLPDLNFPAFDRARDAALDQGWAVLNPADIDRAALVADGGDPINPNAVGSQRRFAYRDFQALHWLRTEDGDAIAMLPGWEKSVGAVAEFFLARWLGLKVLDATTFRPLTPLKVNRHALLASLTKFLYNNSQES